MIGYNEIKKMAEGLGISVRQICINAGVSYRTVHEWSKTNPKAMDTFTAVENYYKTTKNKDERNTI